MKLQDLYELEPQHCVDSDCDGEITFDETNQDYECMKCGKSAKLKEAAYDDDKPAKHQFAWIAVHDMDSYNDWDMSHGYGGAEQLSFDDGILVKKEMESEFRKNVARAVGDDFSE